MSSIPTIRGTWGTVLLPLDVDERIDWAALEEGIDAMIDSRVNGIYSNGTAGEFFNQTEEEFDRLSLILAERCSRAGMPFQLGVSDVSPWRSRERLRRVVALKPLAFQVILPDWSPPTLDESVRFLSEMAAVAGGIPLVLYNPPHAKVRLDPTQFSALRRAVPSIVGVKVPVGDDDWFRAMGEHCPGLSLFVSGHTLASSIGKGAHGAYSNIACLNPRVAREWNEQIMTDLPGALELEGRIKSFLNTTILPFISDQGFSNQAVDKFLACVGGWARISTRLRWPYRSIPETEVEPARRAGRDIIPEFF